MNNAEYDMDTASSPQWVQLVDECHYDIKRIEEKSLEVPVVYYSLVTDLSRLYSATRTTSFDDDMDEDHKIEALTQSITRVCSGNLSMVTYVPV